MYIYNNNKTMYKEVKYVTVSNYAFKNVSLPMCVWASNKITIPTENFMYRFL